LGKTTNKTLERKPYVPKEEVLKAVLEKVEESRDLASITFAGSGEPTLHSRLGELIDCIKARTSARLTVITNGSLLWMPEVRRACMKADLVIPSLDAGDPETFQAVNRPHPSLAFEQMVEGLIDLRKEFQGEIWLEVFLIGDMSGTDSQVRLIREYVDKIRPDKIQLNTAVRPTAEEFALRVEQEALQRFCPLLGPTCEVIASFAGVAKDRVFQAHRRDVLATLSRRPCTLEDIAKGLQIHPNEALKCLQESLSQTPIPMTG